MTRPDSQRVVVTGVGVVTPVGNDTPSTWAAILAGRSGAGPLTRYDHTEFRTHFAAEIKNFDPVLYVGKQDARRMDRFLHLAVAVDQRLQRQRALLPSGGGNHSFGDLHSGHLDCKRSSMLSRPMVRQTALWRKISRGRFLRVNGELANATLLPSKASLR